MFTHLDPDHIEGFRVVEQIALDFRTWHAYPDKKINLLLPEQLNSKINNIQSQYGPVIDFYVTRGFVDLNVFQNKIRIKDVTITAIPVDRVRRQDNRKATTEVNWRTMPRHGALSLEDQSLCMPETRLPLFGYYGLFLLCLPSQ